MVLRIGTEIYKMIFSGMQDKNYLYDFLMEPL